ncbi:MAG: hypothetical protein RIT27_1673 [Pseudomonadota bacterium]|jgi:heptosyltransferase-1
MRILIIKMSSLGDIIHLLPALTDAQRFYPHITFDWVVEAAFAEIPMLHSAVAEVFSIHLRQWRKHPYQVWKSGDWQQFKQQLQQRYYDRVIDAQGLLKSAWIGRLAHGVKAGFDWKSAREPLASWFYQQRIDVPRNQHAIERLRQLMAAAINYPLPTTLPDYGVRRFMATTLFPNRPTLIFLHGTTWATKHWWENHWFRLIQMACAAGFEVRLPWGNAVEKARAQRLSQAHRFASVMPALNLQSLATEISTAQAVIGVDTGLAHLAAALNVPSITLYGATNPALTGTCGNKQIHLQANFKCAPCLKRECTFQGFSQAVPACYETLSPEKVWQVLLARCL